MQYSLFIIIFVYWSAAVYNVGSVPAGCNRYVDVVFIVDSSESMIMDDPYGAPLYHWGLLKNYLRKAVQQLPVSPSECKMALLKYSDMVHIEFMMNQYTDANSINTHINNQLIHVGGNTNTAQALLEARYYLYDTNSGQRADARKVVFLINDGVSNRYQHRIVPEAELIKRTGAEIFVIGLGSDIDRDELNSIASDPKDNHVIIASLEKDLEELLIFTLYGICHLPLPQPPTPNCDVKMDLAIVLDNSGSIKIEASDSLENRNYDDLKRFVESLLDIIEIGELKTKVALVRYSDYATTEFKLTSDKNYMKQRIRNMPFDGGYTNISGALRQTRQQIFNLYDGDRPDVRNVMLIISDGESNLDPLLTAPEANRLKIEGTQLFVVAVLTQVFDETELKDIASDPDYEHYFNSPSIVYLPTIRNNLLKHVCDVDTLSQQFGNAYPSGR